MTTTKACCALLLLVAGGASAWAPAARRHQKNLHLPAAAIRPRPRPRVAAAAAGGRYYSHLNTKIPNADADDEALVASFDPLNLSVSTSDDDEDAATSYNDTTLKSRALLVGSAAALLASSPAAAATAMTAAASSSPDAIPSALAAYGHYLSILIIVGSITTERFTVKPAMSLDDEKRIAAADILTGVSGLALLVSGYYRATSSYGKGWDFYAHEPLFWLKMTFLGIFGGLSLFPTVMIIQRSVTIQRTGTIEPMSDKLARRLTSILNAELSALGLIPLTATLMARGVGYVGEDFPTQIVGPVVFGAVTAGAVYKYVKDALSWTEEDAEVIKEE